MATRTWTVEEVIERGLQALGDEIERLAEPKSTHDLGCAFCRKSDQLPAYMKAVLAISKDARERALMKNLGDVRDAELMRMIASELGIPVTQLQDFIASAKGNGARAS